MDSKKNTYVQLRLTGAEKQALIEKATLCNLKLSDYIRGCIDNVRLHTVPAQISRDHLQEVAAIGNKLNELLCLIEQDQLSITEDVRRLVSQIGELLARESKRHDC